jgi:VCBS repeat-containing protein
MDHGVHTSDGRSAVYVLNGVGDSRVLRERLEHDASANGLSSTGGALQSLSISVEREGEDASSPYVTWTEALNRTEDIGSNDTVVAHEIYLRRDRDVLTAKDDMCQTDEDKLLLANLLANDNERNASDIIELVRLQGNAVLPDTVAELVSEFGARVSVSSKGAFQYDPRDSELIRRLNWGETITERFGYEIRDGQGSVSTATVTVSVTGVNPWQNRANPSM